MTNRAGAPHQTTVGLVQMSMTADPQANLEKAIARVREAAGRGATLICLPELFRTLYIGQREDHDLFNLAEPVPGPSTEALGKGAGGLKGVIGASLLERRAPGLYRSTAPTLAPAAKARGVNRKTHIRDDPSYSATI